MDVFVLVDGEARRLTEEVLRKATGRITVVDADGKIIMRARADVLAQKFGIGGDGCGPAGQDQGCEAGREGKGEGQGEVEGEQEEKRTREIC
ncbi:MAG: hypothetical protein GXO00_02185 [Candidatus Diapherotrites archaeon]|nr:hypothetical protein [Candidatus Diapherotrites archaeon]